MDKDLKKLRKLLESQGARIVEKKSGWTGLPPGPPILARRSLFVPAASPRPRYPQPRSRRPPPCTPPGMLAWNG